ncbi:MAG: polysaccharide biosynthesis protein [Clostridia bacterium]|nr:polysaccharide biosynthesis protein [Clostridia bacterium]
MKHLSVSKQHSSVIGGALYLTVAAVFVKVLGLIYKIPLSHMLGDEGMGYFNAAYTVYGALYLLCTAGVPKAISILTTECDVREARHDKEKIFRVCLWSFGSLGAVLTAFFILCSAPLSRLIGSEPSAFCMIAIAPSLLFVSLGGVVRGYLNGHARMWPIAVSQVLEGVCKLILGLIFAAYALKSGFSLPLTAAFTILGITVGSFVSFLYLSVHVHRLRREAPAREGRAQTSGKDILYRVLKVAAPVTFSAAIMSMTNMMDLTLIMKRLTETGLSEQEATALYGNYTTLAVPMFNLAASLVASVMTAVLPHLTRLYVRGDTSGFRSLFQRTAQSCTVFILPFSFSLVLFGKEILSLLFREESAVLATPMLAVLSPAMIFMGLLTVVNTALEAAGHARAPLYAMAIGCAVKLPVSYLLLGSESYGILGAPIGTVISYAVSLAVSLIILHRAKDIRMSVTACLWKPLINTLASLSVVYLLYRVIEVRTDALPALWICALIGLPLYTILSLCTGVLTIPSKKKMVIFDK